MIKDRYRDTRGGWSRFLEISCNSCGKFWCYYQKDGPGLLKRLYLDRIVGNKPTVDSRGYVYCECGECLGISEPYKKEDNRPAIRMAAESINKRIVSTRQVIEKNR